MRKIATPSKILFCLIFCLICYSLSCSDDPVSTSFSNSDLILSVVSGENQIGTVNNDLKGEFIVKVEDPDHHQVEGVVINFEIISGTGALAIHSDSTNSIGVAKTRLHLDNSIGEHLVKASIANGPQVTFSAYALHELTITSYIKGSGSIKINWSHEQSAGFENYSVYRSDASIYGDSTLVLQSTDTTFTDTSYDPGKEYVYSVYANYQDVGALKSNRYKTKGSLDVMFSTKPFDLAIDSSRHKIYVSLPMDNSIAVVSYDTWEIEAIIEVGNQPYGIDISYDYSKLYIALFYDIDVVVLDLDTYSLTSVDISANLPQAYPYDIKEALPNKVFVTSSGYSPKITLVDFERDPIVRSITDTSILIGNKPLFCPVPNDSILYVTQPLLMGMIDLRDSTFPIYDLVNVVYNSGVIKQYDQSPDGSRLYFPNGNIFGTETLADLANLNYEGMPISSKQGDRFYISRGIGRYPNGYIRPNLGFIVSFDAQTLTPIDSINIDIITINQVAVMPGDTILVFLTEDGLNGTNISSIN